jgi:hypothetical protein
MATDVKKLSPELQPAVNWYAWLWVSPVFTITTLLYLGLLSYSIYDNFLFAVLGSALWHVILLIPALFGKSEFIRWHGRQALLLAAVRTAVAAFAVASENFSIGALSLFCFWLGGNLWGQGEARRGDCSLMRWVGRGGALPLTAASLQTGPKAAAAGVHAARGDQLEIDALVDIIRFDPDPEMRRAALARLERQGCVETL